MSIEKSSTESEWEVFALFEWDYLLYNCYKADNRDDVDVDDDDDSAKCYDYDNGDDESIDDDDDDNNDDDDCQSMTK